MVDIATSSTAADTTSNFNRFKSNLPEVFDFSENGFALGFKSFVKIILGQFEPVQFNPLKNIITLIPSKSPKDPIMALAVEILDVCFIVRTSVTYYHANMLVYIAYI